MKNRELLELAFNSLRYRNLRSWLAILGVVIGVASIVSLISISTGLNDQIQKQLSGLGANIITVSPGGGQAFRFGGPSAAVLGSTEKNNPITFREADTLRHLPGVQMLDARLSRQATVSYLNKNTSITVIGTEPETFPTSANAVLLEGRSLPATGPFAVLGFAVQNSTFGTDMLGKPIRINGRTFRVVGILNATGASFGGADNQIFIPQNFAKQFFNQTENASSVVVVANSPDNTNAVAAQINSTLITLHRDPVSQPDFRITTASSVQATTSSIVGALGLFLGIIAGISLLVGAIGVANSMFTSVLEQTKYIGILKALGARRIEIIKLFLFEACLVGFIGGVLGIALSFVGAQILVAVGAPSDITPTLVGAGLVVSVLVGALSGALPARNAASVPPVEALRYE
ncbi:MAG: ABC transporter permease [Candidatus Micrarchaeota archaeon]|nr:ABC transporter permease [Candidatus Micrarchaeota archaeon]